MINLLAISRIALVLSVLHIIVGCSSRNVALVIDNENSGPEVGDSLSAYILPASIEEDERLVLLRISNQNLLNFNQEIGIIQHPKADSGRSYMEIKSSDSNMDELVLFKFNKKAGPNAFLEPFPCGVGVNGWCAFQRYGKEYHLRLKLPDSGSVAYAGRWHYEIVDQYPHRGTQNSPLLKNMGITSNYKQDLEEALVKWPFLKDKRIMESIGTVKSGRAKEFNF
jgi:hypothetical protein